MKRLRCFTVCYLTFNVSNTGQTSVPSYAFAKMCIPHSLCVENYLIKANSHMQDCAFTIHCPCMESVLLH